MLVDHPEVSQKAFYPRRTDLEPTLRVDVGDAVLGCYLHTPHPTAGTLLHFHGNGELAADYAGHYADLFLQMGVNVCFAEYRGYGASTGTPSLGGMLPDGARIVEALGVPPEKMVVFGRSLGCVYALELVRRYPRMAGLVLESGCADVLETLRLFLDNPEQLGGTEGALRAEIETHFNHKAKLESYQGPLLVLHAVHDRLLECSHGERLYAWGGGKAKQLVLFPNGDHNTILSANFRQYIAELHAFLRRTGVSNSQTEWRL
jgi:pimeloyl-ACP methyl ester carboxylesterase